MPIADRGGCWVSHGFHCEQRVTHIRADGESTTLLSGLWKPELLGMCEGRLRILISRTQIETFDAYTLGFDGRLQFEHAQARFWCRVDGTEYVTVQYDEDNPQAVYPAGPGLVIVPPYCGGVRPWRDRVVITFGDGILIWDPAQGRATSQWRPPEGYRVWRARTSADSIAVILTADGGCQKVWLFDEERAPLEVELPRHELFEITSDLQLLSKSGLLVDPHRNTSVQLYSGR